MKWKLISSPSIHELKKPKKVYRPVLPFDLGVNIDTKVIADCVLISIAITMLWAGIITGAPRVMAYVQTKTTTTPTPVEVVVLAETTEPDPGQMVRAQDDTLLLAIGIDAVISSVPGAEYCTDTALLMIANVIINRTQDARYPGTIMEVLTQPMQFSCFAESGVKWVGRAATNDQFKQRCIDVAKRAIAGERVFGDSSVVYVSSTKQGTIVAQLDGLYFCR